MPGGGSHVNEPCIGPTKEINSCYLKASNTNKPRPLTDYIENIEQFLPIGFPSCLPSSHLDGLPTLSRTSIAKILHARNQSTNCKAPSNCRTVKFVENCYLQDSLGFSSTPDAQVPSCTNDCGPHHSPKLFNTSLETSDSEACSPPFLHKVKGTHQPKQCSEVIDTSLETSDSESYPVTRRSPRLLRKTNKRKSIHKEDFAMNRNTQMAIRDSTTEPHFSLHDCINTAEDVASEEAVKFKRPEATSNQEIQVSNSFLGLRNPNSLVLPEFNDFNTESLAQLRTFQLSEAIQSDLMQLWENST